MDLLDNFFAGRDLNAARGAPAIGEVLADVKSYIDS